MASAWLASTRAVRNTIDHYFSPGTDRWRKHQMTWRQQYCRGSGHLWHAMRPLFHVWRHATRPAPRWPPPPPLAVGGVCCCYVVANFTAGWAIIRILYEPSLHANFRRQYAYHHRCSLSYALVKTDRVKYCWTFALHIDDFLTLKNIETNRLIRPCSIVFL